MGPTGHHRDKDENAAAFYYACNGLPPGVSDHETKVLAAKGME